MADVVTIEDCDLPKSVLQKIIKRTLPDGFSVGKDTKMVLSKACTVFISHLTAIANDSIKGSARKSINAADIFAAIKKMELEAALMPRLEPAVLGFYWS